MSHVDKLPVVLIEMLFVSHEYFCGFGDSKRFTISNITTEGIGLDLVWFLLMQDSTSHCRYTWQKPSESKKDKKENELVIKMVKWCGLSYPKVNPSYTLPLCSVIHSSGLCCREKALTLPCKLVHFISHAWIVEVVIQQEDERRLASR